MTRSMFLAFASAIAVAAGAPAGAAILIGISINGSAVSQIATDNGSGSVSYNATVGDFTYNLGATGYPILTQPNLQTQSLIQKNTIGTAARVSVFFTETDLTSFSGSLTSAFRTTVVTNSGAALNSYYSSSNAPFTGTLLQGNFFGSAGSYSGSDTVNVTGPFSVTLQYDLSFPATRTSTFNGTANLNAVAGVAPVPEPATWAMMLIGFGAIGCAVRRRRSISIVHFA